MECNFLFQKKEITMTTIIHPSYFPNIEYFSYLLNSEDISFEINDFYRSLAKIGMGRNINYLCKKK